MIVWSMTLLKNREPNTSTIYLLFFLICIEIKKQTLDFVALQSSYEFVLRVEYVDFIVNTQVWPKYWRLKTDIPDFSLYLHYLISRQAA